MTILKINKTVIALVFTVDVNTEPAEHVISEGIVAGIPMGRLESGETGAVEMGMCFLSFGRFNIRVDVRIPSQNGSKVGTGQISAIIAEER